MNAQLIDVCLACYLSDHHSRDGELLLGAAVDGATTHREMLAELHSELNALDVDDERFDYDQARAALGGLFAPVADLDSVFNSSLDQPSDDDDGETCQAWILLTY